MEGPATHCMICMTGQVSVTQNLHLLSNWDGLVSVLDFGLAVSSGSKSGELGMLPPNRAHLRSTAE